MGCSDRRIRPTVTVSLVTGPQNRVVSSSSPQRRATPTAPCHPLTLCSYDLSGKTCAFRSAMLQSWNKWCFTGGYLETRLKAPGTRYAGGIGSAVQAVGNLGRLGHPGSLQGTWPFAYDLCDGAARGAVTSGPQKFSACADVSRHGFAPHVGRGAPQLDVWRLVVPPASEPRTPAAHAATGLRLAPRIPPGTSHGGGAVGDCNSTAAACTGMTFHPHNGYHTGPDTRCMAPAAGAEADCVAAVSTLYDAQFARPHRYGMLVEPGESVAWYLEVRPCVREGRWTPGGAPPPPPGRFPLRNTPGRSQDPPPPDTPPSGHLFQPCQAACPEWTPFDPHNPEFCFNNSASPARSTQCSRTKHDAQTAHPPTFSTAPTHQLLGPL